MPRVPLVFGGGLDRETGVMAVRPTSFEDLRNVVVFDGKASVRKGFTERITFGDQTHVIAIQPIKAERTSIIITYDSVTGDVNVWGMDAAGTSATGLGVWFTKASDLAVPPIVTTTEVFSKVFMAHATVSVTDRATTYVYDRRGSPSLHPLEADLDFDGVEEPVLFRGVQRYLDYLVGWGYGDDTDTERPEILRISQPGLPESFQGEHYILVGDRLDPIITAQAAGDTFLVFKETETHELLGYDRNTFGVKPIDPLFGCIGDRLSVNVSGICFFWSAAGPRYTIGTGPSRDTATPLDYYGFDPVTLVAENAVEDAFAVYEPVRRIVLFFWGKRVYALAVRGGLERSRWCWWEILPFTPLSGGVLYQGVTGAFPAPTGFPICTSVAQGAVGELQVSWSNNGQDGDEFLEIWLQQIQQLVSDWAMDTDGGGGVASSFTSTSSGSHTVAFSIDAGEDPDDQKVAVSASTGAGYSGVYQDVAVDVGLTYMLEVEAKTGSLVAGGRGSVTVEWWSVAPALISTETRVPFTDTGYALQGVTSLEATAPVGAVTARIRLDFETQNSGDTGNVWYRNVRFFDSSAEWILPPDGTANVSGSSGQTHSISATVTAGGVYRTRLRYGRGFEYTAGYTAGDQDLWPNTSECIGQSDLGIAIVDDGLHVAFFFTGDSKEHVKLTWATNAASWVAIQAAGVTGGFELEVERPTGGGWGALVTLDANPTRDWSPTYNHQNDDGYAHFGYDKYYFGSTWKTQVPDLPGGPYPRGSPVADLILFEYDDEDLAAKDQENNYRVRAYIGDAKTAWVTRAGWVGPHHEPEEPGGGQTGGHGPAFLSAASIVATEIKVDLGHSTWMTDGLTEQCPGLASLNFIVGNDYGWVPVPIQNLAEIWYRDMGAGPGAWTLDASIDCVSTAPDVQHIITGLTSTNVHEVKVRYNLTYNGETYLGDYSIVRTVTVL